MSRLLICLFLICVCMYVQYMMFRFYFGNLLIIMRGGKLFSISSSSSTDLPLFSPMDAYVLVGFSYRNSRIILKITTKGSFSSPLAVCRLYFCDIHCPVLDYAASSPSAAAFDCAALVLLYSFTPSPSTYFVHYDYPSRDVSLISLHCFSKVDP
jgi:hypothetical protein